MTEHRFENLLVEAADGVMTITVNRPKVLNALNSGTLDELRRALLAARHDDQVRCLIITGAGEKSFIAGADINELAVQTPVTGREHARTGQHVLDLIENMGKPVIAAINGFALGGGCELAMACDIRVAAENARFGQPEVNLGVLAGAGGTQRLTRLVGLGRALELLMTGDIIDAAEAYRIGLANKLVPPGEAVSAARAMAARIMSKGPVAVQLSKLACLHGSNVDLQSGMVMERLAQAVLFSTRDKHEGTLAFLEKRPAQFEGR